MNNLIKDNWNIIMEKVIMPMYEKGYLPSKVVDEIKESLQKQILKEPIYESDGYADGNLIYDTWYCPRCDTLFDTDEEYRYCPNCGQRIEEL